MTRKTATKVANKTTIKSGKAKSVKMKKKIAEFSPSIDYKADLIEYLKNPEDAALYLNTALEESLSGDETAQAVFLQALRNVAEAQGTVSALAQRAKIRRESLYKITSKDGNPRMQTLSAILHAMGFGLQVYHTK